MHIFTYIISVTYNYCNLNTHAYESARNRFPTFDEILDYWNTMRKLRERYQCECFPIRKLIDEKSLNQFFWRMLWLFYPEGTYTYLDTLVFCDPIYPSDCLLMLENCIEVFTSIANDGVYTLHSNFDFKKILDHLTINNYDDEDYYDLWKLSDFYSRIMNHAFLEHQNAISRIQQLFKPSSG